MKNLKKQIVFLTAAIALAGSQAGAALGTPEKQGVTPSPVNKVVAPVATVAPAAPATVAPAKAASAPSPATAPTINLPPLKSSPIVTATAAPAAPAAVAPAKAASAPSPATAPTINLPAVNSSPIVAKTFPEAEVTKAGGCPYENMATVSRDTAGLILPPKSEANVANTPGDIIK